MIGKKKVLALIPARQGSKSIPEKNIMNLGGHPLLAYSIAAAKLSKYIDRVVVSTDSEKFAAVARRYGAEVPFLRPAEYAQDNSLDIEVFRHALAWLEKQEEYMPNLVVHLRPTTPLREPAVVDRAIDEIFSDENATALRSAHESEYTAYKLFRKKGDYINFFGQGDFAEHEEYYNRPRQVLPQTYNCNGYIDVMRPEELRQRGTLHGSRIRAFITDRIADIDDLRDFDFAKNLLYGEQYSPLLDWLNNKKKSHG